MQLFSPTKRKWKEAVSIFLHLCLNNFWAPGPRDLCILKKSSFFLISAAQKHISLLDRTTIDRLLNITVNGVEQQKHNFLKSGERTDWFPEVILELYHHYSRENQIVRRLIIGKILLRIDKSTSFASDKSSHCAFTSPILRFKLL